MKTYLFIALFLNKFSREKTNTIFNKPKNLSKINTKLP